MLMPYESFYGIAHDYSPSPKALVQLAEIFQTSLAATIVRLLKLQIWKVAFILWQTSNDMLEARWITRPDGRLSYDPAVSIINFESSGIYHTLITGELTASWEHFQTVRGMRSGRIQSLRLGANKILS